MRLITHHPRRRRSLAILAAAAVLAAATLQCRMVTDSVVRPLQGSTQRRAVSSRATMRHRRGSRRERPAQGEREGVRVGHHVPAQEEARHRARSRDPEPAQVCARTAATTRAAAARGASGRGSSPRAAALLSRVILALRVARELRAMEIDGRSLPLAYAPPGRRSAAFPGVRSRRRP